MARGLTQTEARTHAAPFEGAVLASIDWTQPWFAPWRERGEMTAAQALQLQSVAQALNAGQTPPQSDEAHRDEAQRAVSAGLGDIVSAASVSRARAGRSLDVPTPITFVPQSKLPSTQAYEAFIFETQQVPTRDGLHDFFNGLCWQRFPLAKRRLNQLQATEIQTQGVRATRGPVRDALTLFDENALLMQAPDVLWQALQARDWRRLFVDLRSHWQEVHLVLFGHALLEKLVTPYSAITSHVYRVDAQVAAHEDAELDAWLAHDLQPAKLATKPYEPLPVLGVPGWWAANQAPEFYDDATVFRPKRVPAPAPTPAPRVTLASQPLLRDLA